MMERKRVRRILVNNYFSEAYCVLNDNYSGMSKLIDHLESRGCRKIFLATRHFNSLGIANLSERNYAFENECNRRGIEYRTLGSGSFNELLKLIKGSSAPDALIFSSDGPALKLRDILAKSKSKKIPIIAGFDGWNEGEPVNDIITVKVNYEGLGAAAVDLMLNNTLEDWGLPDIKRVPCSIFVPENS
jgi:DNA-binding LacI/PurR family transcriptional regulator